MKKHEHQKKVTKPKVSPIVKEKIDPLFTRAGSGMTEESDSEGGNTSELSHDAGFRARNRIPY